MNKSLNMAVAAFAAMAIAFGGCHSQKQSASAVVTPVTQNVSSAADARAQLVAMSRDNAKWQKMRLPMTIRLQSPKKISISGTMTMERDKSVLLSLRFFGMEIGVLYLTPDSILVMDKYNKRYVSERLDSFLGGIPVTLSNVQDLLIGRAFILGKSEPDMADMRESDFDMVDGNAGWMYVPSSNVKGLDYGFTFASPCELLALIIKEGAHNPVMCTYDKPVATEFGPLATAVGVKATAGKTNIDASIEWNVSKVRWNDDVDLRAVTVPAGYQKIESSDVVKMLKAF